MKNKIIYKRNKTSKQQENLYIKVFYICFETHAWMYNGEKITRWTCDVENIADGNIFQCS